jgi:hypothetical protein
VTTRLIALQQFQSIACRHRKIVDPTGRVNQLQFPLNTAPEIPRDSPSAPCVSFAKQIDRRPVCE